MKKVLIGTLVLAMAIPALAAVTVTTDETVAGQVKLTFTSDTEIVGIGLKVDANANIASFTVDDDLGTPDESYFDLFMDVAYSQKVNGDGYTYGEGAGAGNINGADQAIPGVVALPATNFSISAGGLGGQTKPLDPVPQVAQVILKGVVGTVVDVDLDLLRGGIVDFDGTQTVIGLPVELTIPGGDVSVVIVSAHGQVDPPVGTHSYAYGDSVSLSVTNDMLIQGATQYVYTGWNMTGHAPASGDGTNVQITTLTNDLVLTWLWATNNSLASLGTPEWWLASYGLTNGTSDEEELLDGDGDDILAWMEWVCDTDPTNGNSVLKITNIAVDGSGAQVDWKGGVLATQYLERRTNLLSGSSWMAIFTNVPPTSISTNFNDVGVTNSTSVFYRIKAQR